MLTADKVRVYVKTRTSPQSEIDCSTARFRPRFRRNLLHRFSIVRPRKPKRQVDAYESC